jgi:hypothetical protein
MELNTAFGLALKELRHQKGLKPDVSEHLRAGNEGGDD